MSVRAPENGGAAAATAIVVAEGECEARITTGNVKKRRRRAADGEF